MTDEYGGRLAEHHGITDRQLDLIWWAIDEMRSREWTPITYMEIGVLYGGVLRRALERLQEPGDVGYGLDLFETFPDHVDENTHGGNVCKSIDLRDELYKRKLFNFSLIVGDSAETMGRLGSWDHGLAVIDGNHTYKATAIDFRNCFKAVKKGFFFFHDIDWAGPRAVADEIVERQYLLKRVKEVPGARLYERS